MMVNEGSIPFTRSKKSPYFRFVPFSLIANRIDTAFTKQKTVPQGLPPLLIPPKGCILWNPVMQVRSHASKPRLPATLSQPYVRTARPRAPFEFGRRLEDNKCLYRLFFESIPIFATYEIKHSTFCYLLFLQ